MQIFAAFFARVCHSVQWFIHRNSYFSIFTPIDTVCVAHTCVKRKNCISDWSFVRPRLKCEGKENKSQIHKTLNVEFEPMKIMARWWWWSHLHYQNIAFEKRFSETWSGISWMEEKYRSKINDQAERKVIRHYCLLLFSIPTNVNLKCQLLCVDNSKLTRFILTRTNSHIYYRKQYLLWTINSGWNQQLKLPKF